MILQTVVSIGFGGALLEPACSRGVNVKKTRNTGMNE